MSTDKSDNKVEAERIEYSATPLYGGGNPSQVHTLHPQLLLRLEGKLAKIRAENTADSLKAVKTRDMRNSND